MHAERVLLIDGMNLIYRGYYASLPADPTALRRAPDGRPVNAIAKSAEMLANLLTAQKPTHAAVVMDGGRSTWRLAAFPSYKAQREEPPDDLVTQIGALPELLSAWGIAMVVQDGVEADDLMASMANRYACRDRMVTVYSNDRDMLQIVSDQIAVLQPRHRKPPLLVTAENIEAVHGLRPDQVVDYKALSGDKGDNLPNIPGIGDGIAKRLLRQYGSLQEIIASTWQIGGRLAERIEEHAEQARLVRRLATLQTDLPVPPLESLTYVPTREHQIAVDRYLSALRCRESGVGFTGPILAQEATARPRQRNIMEMID